jgi:hypothetical protein
VSPLDLDSLLSLPFASHSLHRALAQALSLVLDPSAYLPLEWDGKLSTARGLSPEDVADLLLAGKIEPTTEADAKNTVRIFKVAELAKRRFRLIGWTKNINDVWTEVLSVVFESIRERHEAVWRGDYAITVDFKSWYDQFQLHALIRAYHTFLVGSDAYRLCRLPMGQRQSVPIGHYTTLLLLDQTVAAHTSAYIDNVRFVGSREDVINDAAVFFLRCKAAGAQLNELDLSSITTLDDARVAAAQLVASSSEWLGEHVNYHQKQVKCSDKTLQKVRITWAARASWSWQTMAAHFSLLFYASSTLGLSLAPFFGALRYYRRASSLLSDCPARWGERANPLLPHELDALDRWTQSVLANVARRVPNPGAPVDYVVVTDASAWGWGALVYDASSGCVRVHQHEWDDAFTGRAQSTRAEPEAIWRALCKTLSADVRCRVLVLTDNSPAVAALTAGYSPSFDLNAIVGRVRASFPLVDLMVVHVPGKTNPSDPLSRGGVMTEEHWSNLRGLLDRFPVVVHRMHNHTNG